MVAASVGVAFFEGEAGGGGPQPETGGREADQGVHTGSRSLQWHGARPQRTGGPMPEPRCSQHAVRTAGLIRAVQST